MSDGKKIDDGGLAFPSLRENDNPSMPLIASGFGMTLREYYAGQAMVGLLSSGIAAERGHTHRDVADIAVINADALISALKVTP